MFIKTHGSVSCGPRTQSTWQTSVHFTGAKKMPFWTSVARHSLDRNTLCEFLWGGIWVQIWNWGVSYWIHQAVPEIRTFKFVLFSLYFSSPSSFHNTFWNHYNLCMLWWTALKFGALIEHIRAYLWYNFCSNGIKKHRVITNLQNF